VGIVISPDGSATRVTPSAFVQVRESITDVARQIEDLNWVNLSTDRPGYDLVYDDRKRLLQRIRLYRRRSPLAKQAAQLLQHYVLGQGISIKPNNKAMVARIVDEFWEDPVNEAVFTSHQAQKEALDSLFTDGDLFIVLFPDKVNGTVHLGLLDAIFVEDVITDPENAKVPKWYKARMPDNDYNFGSGNYEARTATDFRYYRDWRNEDASGGKGAPKAKFIAEGLVYHVKINRRGKFGESELAAALDWLKSHKDFMEDRVSLNRAAAAIAWKKKRKGGASDIAAEVTKMQSSLVSNIQRYEANPPQASASTIVENEGSDLQWAKTDTGGASALADERILRMMAGSGMGGIPNHYFGDEANANLATATAMELPLLKTYEDWQKLWGDVLDAVIQFALSVAHDAERLGDRDDSSRYADKATNPTAVLATPDVHSGATQGKSASAPSLNTQGADTGSGQRLSEAFGAAPAPATVPDSATAVATSTGGMVATPAANVRDPALAITLIKKEEPSYLIGVEDRTTGAIDWTVSIDFPAIIQKDVGMMLTALKILYEFLPTQNIESQKLVVEMALSVFGENDIGDIIGRLFPPGTEAPGTIDAKAKADQLQANLAKAQQPDQSAGLAGALTKALGSGKPDGATDEKSTEDKAVAESLAEYRVRRVLRAARDASTALAVVG
jgi:hypothetical protein